MSRLMVIAVCLLLVGCTSFEKNYKAREDLVIARVKQYYVAHGGHLDGLDHLFNKESPIEARINEAKLVTREVWEQLVGAGQSGRVDFQSEFTMMLAIMLSYASNIEPEEIDQPAWMYKGLEAIGEEPNE